MSQKNPTQLFTSLYYAHYKPLDWGRFAWFVFFLIAMYVEQMSPAERRQKWPYVRAWFGVLPDVLPCRTCVGHFSKYMAKQGELNPDTCSLCRIFYHLRQTIRRRVMRTEWEKCKGDTTLQWKCLMKQVKRSYSYEETVGWYRRQTLQTCVDSVLSFLHFVALTYPDLHEEALGKNQSSQQRREAIQRLLCEILPVILPMPQAWWTKWQIMCRDLKVWVNRYTLMIALYQCTHAAGYLPAYDQRNEGLDMYINRVHQRLLPARNPGVIAGTVPVKMCACDADD